LGILGEVEEFQMNYGMSKGVLVQNKQGQFEYATKASLYRRKFAQAIEEKKENVGTAQVTVEPANNNVDKAIQKIRENSPEIITPLTNIRTDLNKDIFGEFSSEHEHTVFLNVPKIENEVRTKLEGSSEDDIQTEIINQIALVISHEFGHQHAYTNNGDTSEAPAEQKEKEVKEKITSSYRKKIMAQMKWNSSVVFSAILLTKASKQALLEAFPPKHRILQDCHVTLAFRPGRLPENLGEVVHLTAYGYANDNKADAVSVKLYDEVSTNEIPHITLSVSEGTRPVYSNELLARGYDAVEPLELNGVIAAFMGPDGYITSIPEPPEPVFEDVIEAPAIESGPAIQIENTNLGENNV